MNPQKYVINIRPGVGIPPTVNVSQGDIERPLLFTIMDGLTPLAIDSEHTTVTITGTKPSGLGYTITGDIDGSDVTFYTTEEMTQEPGFIRSELIVTGTGSTFKLGSANFDLVVEPTTHGTGVIDGTTEDARTVLARCEEYASDAAASAAEAASEAGAAATAGATAGTAAAEAVVDDIEAEISDLKSDLDYTNKVLKSETGRALYEWKLGRIKTGTTTIDITDIDTSDSNTWYHAVIPCSGGDVFYLKVDSATSTARPYATVNASGSRQSVYNANAIDETITMPSTAAYLIVNSRYKPGVVYGGSSRIGVVESDIASAENEINTINATVQGITESIDFIQNGTVEKTIAFNSQKYINFETGEEVNNSNYHATDYIPIEPFTNQIDTNCKGTATGTDGYAFYNSAKTYISGGKLIRYGITRIPVPNGAEYIRLSSRTAYEETGVSRYVKCVGSIQIKPNAGYNVVMLGDSLIGNYDGEDSVPHYLEDFSGAICHNCAFGGSNLGTDTVGSINQLLLPFRGFKVIEAIVSNDYSEMDTAISDDPNFETLINYYPFHVATLKNMDWNKVDVITMSWGTNDWSTSVTLENSENLKDTNTVAGALRTALETLWSVYPHIKVMIFGPIWRGGTITDGELSWESDSHPNSVGLYLKQYNEIEKTVAEEYHVPFVEMYNHTNINKYTWTNYFPTTGTNATHPNSKGRYVMARRYAQYLAEL